MKRTLITLLLTTVLASCASTSPIKTDTDWYLRSEFTWWEAKGQYKLRPQGEQALMVTEFDVAPDGTVFHLKIADRQWSKNRNCGMVEASENEIRLSTWYPLLCDYDRDEMTPLYKAYHFYPAEKGRYQLQVKFTEGRPSAMQVLAIKP